MSFCWYKPTSFLLYGNPVRQNAKPAPHPGSPCVDFDVSGVGCFVAITILVAVAFNGNTSAPHLLCNGKRSWHVGGISDHK